MKRATRIIDTTLRLTLTLGLLAGAVPARAEDEPDDWDAQIVGFEGKVEVQTGGEDSDFAAIEKGDLPMPLDAGDVVRTSKDGRVEIGLSGTGSVELHKLSTFVVTDRSAKRGMLKLRLGTLLAKFDKLRTGQSIRVEAKSAVAAVRGTEFGVAAEDDGAKVAVFDEGEVEVAAVGEGEPVTLRSNQETEVLVGGRPAPPAALKYFAFHKQRMEIVRKRHELIRGRWKKRNLKQRERLKKRIERLRKLKRGNKGGKRQP